MKSPDRTPAKLLEIACIRAQWLRDDLAKNGRLATCVLNDLEQGHYAMAQVTLVLLKSHADELARQIDVVLEQVVALIPSTEGGQND